LGALRRVIVPGLDAEIRALLRQPATMGFDFCVNERQEQELARYVPPEYSISAHPWTALGEWNGIIRHLGRNGNVCLRGIVTITAKSVGKDSALKNLVELLDKSQYISDFEQGQWVQLDFRGNRVVLAEYQVRSDVLSSWVLEAGTDPDDLKVIDSQSEGFAKMNTKSFTLKEMSEPCRYVRLSSTGPNSSGHGLLCLEAFEVFGSLLEPRELGE
jgi:hypothetical protein